MSHHSIPSPIKYVTRMLYLPLGRVSANAGKRYLRNPRASQKQISQIITMYQSRYHFFDSDSIEDVEMYRPGGFYPISIGDVFANGRYKVLHKLGYGGSSTVWLARDQRPQSSASDTLVALRVISADQSSKPKDEIPDLIIPSKLDAFVGALRSPARHNLLTVKDHFMEEGPNGTHLCIISQFAGPSVASMSRTPIRMAGSKRLRGDLARKVAKQVAIALEFMHSKGFVHGGSSSIHLSVKMYRRLIAPLPRPDSKQYSFPSY